MFFILKEAPVKELPCLTLFFWGIVSSTATAWVASARGESCSIWITRWITSSHNKPPVDLFFLKNLQRNFKKWAIRYQKKKKTQEQPQNSAKQELFSTSLSDISSKGVKIFYLKILVFNTIIVFKIKNPKSNLAFPFWLGIGWFLAGNQSI